MNAETPVSEGNKPLMECKEGKEKTFNNNNNKGDKNMSKDKCVRS